MRINKLITHEQASSGADSTRAQPSQQYAHSYVSVSPGQGSPRDSPSNPRVPGTCAHGYIKTDLADMEVDGFTIVPGGPSLKRASPDSDDEADNAAAGTPDKKVRRLSDVPRPSTEAVAPEAVVYEFACPFYKRNRGRYCHQRSCRTSGWPSVHRVKEHLYRHHMHYVCDRCSKTFKVQDSLREHLRQEVACEVSLPSVEEDSGFDAEIEKRLRSRKKIEGQNEVDKWNHMFRILFPSFAAKQPPSPFVEYSLSPQDDQSVSAPAVNEIADFRTAPVNSLQMMAMAAVSKQETGSTSPVSLASLATLAPIAGASVDLPPIVDGAFRHGFAAYPHDGPEAVPYGPGWCTNIDPRTLSSSDVCEIIHRQVLQVLSTIPNSPISSIAHRP